MKDEGYTPGGVVYYVLNVFAVYHGMTGDKSQEYFERTGLADYVREWWQAFAYNDYWTMMCYARRWLAENGIEPPSLVYNERIGIKWTDEGAVAADDRPREPASAQVRPEFIEADDLNPRLQASAAWHRGRHDVCSQTASCGSSRFMAVIESERRS